MIASEFVLTYLVFWAGVSGEACLPFEKRSKFSRVAQRTLATHTYKHVLECAAICIAFLLLSMLIHGYFPHILSVNFECLELWLLVRQWVQ